MRKSMIFLTVIMLIGVVLSAGCLGGGKEVIKEQPQASEEQISQDVQETSLTDTSPAIDELNVSTEEEVEEVVNDLDIDPNIF